jgi:hypothetical protein
MELMKKPTPNTITVDNNQITYYRINADTNGNPRYVVHFLDLNIQLADYGKIPNLTKYRAKWFGGGYVIQSYSIKDDLQHALNIVKDYYQSKAKEQN